MRSMTVASVFVLFLANAAAGTGPVVQNHLGSNTTTTVVKPVHLPDLKPQGPNLGHFVDPVRWSFTPCAAGFSGGMGPLALQCTTPEFTCLPVQGWTSTNVLPSGVLDYVNHYDRPLGLQFAYSCRYTNSVATVVTPPVCPQGFNTSASGFSGPVSSPVGGPLGPPWNAAIECRTPYFHCPEKPNFTLTGAQASHIATATTVKFTYICSYMMKLQKPPPASQGGVFVPPEQPPRTQSTIPGR